MYKEVELPYKPYVPESLLVLACCLAITALIVMGCFSVFVQIGAVVVCSMSTSALCRWRSRSKTQSIVCVSLIVACALSGGIHQQQFVDTAQALQHVAPSACKYELLSDSTQTRFGWKARALCIYRSAEHPTQTLRAQVWLSSKEPLQYGKVIQLVGRYKKNASDQSGQHNAVRGICGTVQVVHVTHVSYPDNIRGAVIAGREKLLDCISPDARASRALLAGCICGYKTGLSSFGISQSLASCGLAHMVAVSGAHLTLIAHILMGCIGKTSLKPAWRMGIVIAVTGLFVVLCGCPASAIRAWLMSITTQTSVLLGRRPYALSALCVCGIGMLMIEPYLVMDLGFLLSVSSVMGLCLFNSYGTYIGKLILPQLSGPLPEVVRKSMRVVQPIQESMSSSAVTSCVALISTLPLVVQIFGKLPLVGPFSNCVIGPLFVLFIMLGVIATPFLFVPLLGDWLLALLDVLGEGILLLARWFSRLPLACITLDASSWWVSVVVMAVLVLVVLVWPRLSARAVRSCIGGLLCLFALWFVRVRYFAPPRVVVCDVGQGDAIVFQDGPHALLVDTGPKGAVIQALGRNHVVHLDGILLTHLHDDHIGGMEELSHSINAQQVFVGNGVKPSISPELEQYIRKITGTDAQELMYGAVISVGRFSLRSVWPHNPADGTHNADSVMLLCTYQDNAHTHPSVTILLTGDAEKDELEHVLQSQDVGKIDVLKVGHHGSEVSLTPSQAQKLMPRYSLISVGAHNKYGHPTHTCLDALSQAGSQVLCTKDYGDLELRPDSSGGFAIMGAHKGGIDD